MKLRATTRKVAWPEDAARALDVLRRVRHVHIPDVPPTYSPPNVVKQIQQCTEYFIHQAAKERSSRVSGQNGNLPTWYRPTPAPTFNANMLKFWVASASPPPVVLTFTSRPVFEVPWAAETEQNSLIIEKCRKPLAVALPPPSDFEAQLWGVGNEDNLYATQYEWGNPLVDLNYWAQEQRYHGPGVLSFTTSLDVVDVSDDETLNQKIAARQKSIQQATIAVLAAEYGLDAHTIDGSPGLWVVSRHNQAAPAEVRRQIATFAPPQERGGVVRLGASIHLGYPPREMVTGRSHAENPWARIGQKDTVTSVAAELCEATLREGAERLNRSPTVRWRLQDHGKILSLCSLVHWKTTSSYDEIPAPFGMDNYDVASAWALEFAAQCGIEYVDHYSDTNAFVERTVSNRRTVRNLAPMPRVYRINQDAVSRQSSPGVVRMFNNSLDVARSGQVTIWQTFVEQLCRHLKSATLGVGRRCYQKDGRLAAWQKLGPWRRAQGQLSRKENEHVSPMARAAEAARGWLEQP